MFETAELGQTVSKQEYAEREPALREKLLLAQSELRQGSFPVVLLFAGVDAAGKGETANLLHEWMDPRSLITRAFDTPSQEEVERPEYWRYWRYLPPRGRIGIFLSAWYHEPLMQRVNKKTDDGRFDDRLDEIASFERTLAADGALILKFWMHLSESAQRKRLKTLEKDPLQRWRVTKQDWDHWKLYDRFLGAAERLIMRTSTGHASWTIVEGVDARYRSLRVGEVLLDGIRRRLAEQNALSGARSSTPVSVDSGDAAQPPGGGTAATVLSRLDMSCELSKKEYQTRLQQLQGRLNLLHRQARERKTSLILVFEGWDAAGKGGAIRRITPAFDARAYEVISIAAPSDEERAHHYLWRFWRHLPRAGRVAIFDRSWYGRVLVERVEGLASDAEWRRAYAEINEFEHQLIDHGIVLVKFWLHITKDEQKIRFKARAETPHKRWKLGEEDWRNREKWDSYEIAVNRMVEMTSTRAAPWNLIPANDKRHARIEILERVCETLDRSLPDRP